MKNIEKSLPYMNKEIPTGSPAWAIPLFQRLDRLEFIMLGDDTRRGLFERIRDLEEKSISINRLLWLMIGSGITSVIAIVIHTLTEIK